jgi:hypothetical protein
MAEGLVNKELERMWKEAVITKFEKLPRNIRRD